MNIFSRKKKSGRKSGESSTTPTSRTSASNRSRNHASDAVNEAVVAPVSRATQPPVRAASPSAPPRRQDSPDAQPRTRRTSIVESNEPLDKILPTTWDLHAGNLPGGIELYYERSNQCRVGITGKSNTSEALLLTTNLPVPGEALKNYAFQKQGLIEPSLQAQISTSSDHDLSNLTRRSVGVPRSSSGSLYPTLGAVAEQNFLYYFEVRVISLSSEACMAIGMVQSGTYDVPGKSRNSIGLTSEGDLIVSGQDQRLISNGSRLYSEGFTSGDTIGFGVEIEGMQRVLFTKNGKLILLPTSFHNLDLWSSYHRPAIGLTMKAETRCRITGNFGMEAERVFKWQTSDFTCIQTSVMTDTADQCGESDSMDPSCQRSFPQQVESANSLYPTNALGCDLLTNPNTPGSTHASRNFATGGNNSNHSLRHDSPHDSQRSSGQNFESSAFSEDSFLFTTSASGTATSTARQPPEPQRESNGFGNSAEEEKSPLEDYLGGSNSTYALSPDEIESVKENANMLNSLCASDEAIDVSVLESLLDCCRADQQLVKAGFEKAMMDDNPNVDLMKLITLNDLVLDVVKLGEEKIRAEEKKKIKTPKRQRSSASGRVDLDIGLLVRKKDVFSLICILRAQSDQRLDAALALMKFSQGDGTDTEETTKLQSDIRSSGGMHSLLTVFRAKTTGYELRVVAAMAVAYVLPSFVESTAIASTQGNGLTTQGNGLKLMECLRFLSTARPVTPNGQPITRVQMYKACITGVICFWMNGLSPMLNTSGLSSDDTDVSARITASNTFDQRHQTIELEELLEMTVALIVTIERTAENESLEIQQDKEDSLFLGFRYTNVEQMCAVDVARPIAVREGLLPILVGWIKCKDKDKERAHRAVSALRYLTSIKDKYMAGWIHSQMVNEGALGEVVKIADDYYAGQDVRLAVAQILASLCVAPHTRAAVVEAQCINYLIGFLYDHSNLTSQEIAYFAGTALTQLAAGAITRASVFGGGETEFLDFVSPDKRDSLVDDIVNSVAIGSFIAIAVEHGEQLRSMAIQAIKVLSEDTIPKRRTRLQLCEQGAARALGKALKDDVTCLPLAVKHGVPKYGNNESYQQRAQFGVQDSLNELHLALCALANILAPIDDEAAPPTELKRQSSAYIDPRKVLVQGCMETAESGGLASLLYISSLPLTSATPSRISDFNVQRHDLLGEACRSLTSLAPLLLSNEAAREGYARWTGNVLEAFNGILKQTVGGDAKDDLGTMRELIVNALRGLDALAGSEPLKIRIVDTTLPSLVRLKNLAGGQSDVSNFASQVFLSLGFEEDEIAVQVAGNNPNLLADWFCLKRQLIIQNMSRAELRSMLVDIWGLPFAETKEDDMGRLVPDSAGSLDLLSVESQSVLEADLFENFTQDDGENESVRISMLQQYEDVYSKGMEPTFEVESLREDDENLDGEAKDTGLLSRHVFPLSETKTEIDWILSHQRAMQQSGSQKRMSTSVSMPKHIDALLCCAFPSKLLQNHLLPIFNLRTGASFNFRALMMPQRRYFSFRREGQMMSRLCDIHQPGLLESDDIHWTLGFTNSTFAGEFSETLMQALYLCPTIRGISFARDKTQKESAGQDETNGDDDGNVFLARLVGSLPPWIDYLTFKNIFDDKDMRTLVANMETMGKLSDNSSSTPDTSSSIRNSAPPVKGRFWSFAISHSPEVSTRAWHSFFSLLGQTESLSNRAASSPLSSLKVLDLSFNKLGDESCGVILGLIHNANAGATLEQLDLSGNEIGKGTFVLKALTDYVDTYRFIPIMEREGWGSTLHTLNLSLNNLGIGQAGFEILSLLKYNALGLKVLDLSENGLHDSENDYYFSEVLTTALRRNSVLCNLNLSGNRFSSSILDDVLGRLNDSDVKTGLAFLGFDSNSPTLSSSQNKLLETFLMKSRSIALKKSMEENKASITEESEEQLLQWASELMTDQETTTEKKSMKSSLLLDDIGMTSTLSMVADKEEPQGDNKITVLFSAPLVFTDERRMLRPFAKLDFDMERELMWQCMKEASRDIELSFDSATHDRLLAAMTKRCSCLHYSGHGHQMYLPFEDGSGGPNWFKVDDIKRLITREGGAPFKFVFVSACHSGLAGETFASAGVPHVVCCQQEFELKDTAALAFTRQFYLSLVIGHTVKESFEQGCKAVRATPNLRDAEKEMNKFLLLPKDGNHDVPVFRAKPVMQWPRVVERRELRRGSTRRSRYLTRQGSIHGGMGTKQSELSVRNMMQEDPSPTPPQFFLGREIEMYYVLKAVLDKRLVSVVGPPGIGRSSLVCALCHYINERSTTIIGIEKIFFVKAKQSRRTGCCRALVEQLQAKLAETDNGGRIAPERGADMEDIFDFICKVMKNEKALLVFAEMELLENSDDFQEFPLFLSSLFRGTKNVKVLMTGRKPLGIPSLGGQVENAIPLGQLSFANTVRLFANLCPHLHTPGERHKLLMRLVTDGEQAEMRPGDGGATERTKEIFGMLGFGIPARIEKSAYDMSQEDLQQLVNTY